MNNKYYNDNCEKKLLRYDQISTHVTISTALEGDFRKSQTRHDVI